MDELIDRIYEAAVIPEQWPGVLDAIATLSGSSGGLLFTTDHKQVTRWTASEAVVPVVTAFIEGDWVRRNPRGTPAAHQVGLAGFANDFDIFTPDELDRDPMYVELLRPLGYGWFGGTHILVPSGEVAVFDVERLYEAGPMSRADLDRLNILRPHLARAALLSTRLGLERARAAVEVLETLGLPAAVLAAGARVLAANASLEAESRISIGARDRLCFVAARIQAVFAEALAQHASSHSNRRVRSFPIPGGCGDPPAVAHLIPVRRAAHDIFVRAEALLVLTPLATSGAFNPTLLSGLFDLTPAEARVAQAVAEGQTVDGYAASMGVSRETVRTQLKSVLAKTGTGRQAELVRLLGSARSLRLTP